ncbi:CaiB/BaiF CoA transferase family protein [Aeromicrobium sp. P5_D10]
MPVPLTGLKVVELAGIGPGPHAAMMLADHGADVIRIERPGTPTDLSRHHTLRSRTTVQADLKDPDDAAMVRRLVEVADVLIEGYRPGVTERLGLGPDECLAANPRLVYARMTGWGQTGPGAPTAGHDINYLALTGVLHSIGPAERPLPPVNFVGDFGGGSMMLVTGILAALFARERTGRGDVVDAAIVDGAAALAQHTLELRADGLWASDERADNLLDGGAPFYRCYRCADERFVAVGAIEPQFYSALLQGLGLDEASLPPQMDRDGWPIIAENFTRVFASQDRDAWAERFASTDACVTPVLTFEEAPRHPHVEARGALVRTGSVVIAATAPRLASAADATRFAARDLELAEAVRGWTTCR